MVYFVAKVVPFVAKGGPVLMAKGGILLVAEIGILYLTIYKRTIHTVALFCDIVVFSCVGVAKSLASVALGMKYKKYI